MSDIVALSRQIPPALLFIIAAVALLALVVGAMFTSSRLLFKRRLARVAAAPERAEAEFGRRYRDGMLLLHSSLVERIARREGRRIVELTGADRLWVERLARYRRARDAARVIEFAPDRGLFTCFIAALQRRRIAAMLLQWLTDSDDFLPLRRIALSGIGEPFDGAAAYRLLSHRLDEIREMAGDPEWAVRYFAGKIMLHDQDPRTDRVLWSCFDDAHRLVRRTVAAEFMHTDRQRLYERLVRLCLRDPVFEVRRQARRRIAVDFPELFQVSDRELTEVEAYHLLELLQPESIEDEALAFRYLEHPNLELRLPAAAYLQRTGALSRLFRRVNPGDHEDLERTERLLRNACEVNVTEFLESLNPENAGSLLLGARLLTVAGNAQRVHPLLERALDLPGDQAVHQEIFFTALDAAHEHGGEAVLQLLLDALRRRRFDADRADAILDRLPSTGAYLSAPVLLELLQDPDAAARPALERAIGRLPVSATLPTLLRILRDGREQHAHVVRISALRIIGALQVPFCLQFLVENLATLRPEDAREFTGVIASFAGKEFDERAQEILGGPDAVTRASLILSLPATGNRDYLKAIREAMGDADPDVRIAAVWALQLYGDSRSLNQAHDLLRDPVERVREAAAEVLGTHGSASVLEQMRSVLADPDEVEPVKLSAIRGLGASQQAKSIAVLTEMLGVGGEYQEPIITALAAKRTARQVEALVEQLKDAEPRLREKLSRVFQTMGAEGERAMVELLQQDIASLRLHVTAVLEELGFVEATIRKLASRDPQVRREAAGTLAVIGTTSAFRGIVVAARDPDQEVRVQVTRALDMLAGKEGKEILAELSSDPDRRVRKYTLWAMERRKAKAL